MGENTTENAIYQFWKFQFWKNFGYSFLRFHYCRQLRPWILYFLPQFFWMETSTIQDSCECGVITMCKLPEKCVLCTSHVCDGCFPDHQKNRGRKYSNRTFMLPTLENKGQGWEQIPPLHKRGLGTSNFILKSTNAAQSKSNLVLWSESRPFRCRRAGWSPCSRCQTGAKSRLRSPKLRWPRQWFSVRRTSMCWRNIEIRIVLINCFAGCLGSRWGCGNTNK